MNKKRSKFTTIKLVSILLMAAFLLSLSGCAYITRLRDDTLPVWIEDLVWEDPELLWAYQNGYFFEEPITDEIGDTKFVIWAVISDDVLTQVLLSAEAIEGDECLIYGSITALDGVSIDAASKFGAYTDYGRVNAIDSYIFTPAPGDHVLTVQFYDPQSHSVVLEKQLDFNSSELAALDTTYQIDQTIVTDGGSLMIDKVIYTPSMIYVSVVPDGADRIYYKDFYIQADNKEVFGTVMQNEPHYLGDPYYMAFPRPQKADEVELVIPYLAYNKEADLSFSKSDVGQTKSLEGTELTLQDWRVTSEGLELEIAYSDTGNLEEILEWMLPDSGIRSIDFYPFDFRERTAEPKVINYQFNPIFHSDEWLTADAVTITMVKVSQEGQWTLELPAIEE